MSQDLELRLMELLRPALSSIVQEIEAEATKKILAKLGAPDTITGDSAPHVSAVRSLPGRTARKPSSNRLFPPHCVYPSCTKQHKGPRFSFMCEEHYGTPKKDKAKFLAAWKQSHSG